MRLTYTLTPANLFAAAGRPIGMQRPLAESSSIGLVLSFGFVFMVPWGCMAIGPVGPARAGNWWPAVGGAAAFGIVSSIVVLLVLSMTAGPRSSIGMSVVSGGVVAALMLSLTFAVRPVPWHLMLVTLAPTQAAAGVMVLTWFTAASRNLARKRAAVPPGRPVVVDVVDAGLRVGADTLHPWTTLHDVIERPAVLVIFAGPADRLIIPRRAFASVADDRDFRDLLRSHRAYRPAAARA